jgi:hypothetical protein
MVDRPRIQKRLDGPEEPLYREQPLVLQRYLRSREISVGAQHELAVEARILPHLLLVDGHRLTGDLQVTPVSLVADQRLRSGMELVPQSLYNNYNYFLFPRRGEWPLWAMNISS